MVRGEDQHRLSAAHGWLELGDCLSASAELDEMSPVSRASAEVLKLRWEIFGKAGNWTVAHQLAENIRAGAPNNPWGWHATALSLHKLGRTAEAFNLITQAPLRPGKEPSEMLYLTARLACCLGDLKTAKTSLSKAFEFSKDAAKLKVKALEEPDLEALWKDSEADRSRF